MVPTWLLRILSELPLRCSQGIRPALSFFKWGFLSGALHKSGNLKQPTIPNGSNCIPPPPSGPNRG
ncbi:MAG: hypothetical protein AB8A40_10420, partial [Prochlorococcus sp.]